MSAEQISVKLKQLEEAIGLCRHHSLAEPTLILLYSAMDICSWLANDDPNAGVGKYFVAWTARFMDPANTIGCTPDDLYGARCGLVHMLSPDSAHNKKGKARQLSYAWGTGKAEELNRVFQKAGKSHLVVGVHIDALRKCWSDGLQAFMAELAKDPAWAQRVYQRAAQFFADFGATKEGKFDVAGRRRRAK